MSLTLTLSLTLNLTLNLALTLSYFTNKHLGLSNPTLLFALVPYVIVQNAVADLEFFRGG